MRIARAASQPGIGALSGQPRLCANTMDTARYRRSSGVAGPPGRSPG